MNIKEQVFQGPDIWRYNSFATYFRLVDSGAAVDIRFYRNNSQIQSASNVEAGYWASFKEPYDSVEIETSGSQNVRIATSLESTGGYDRMAGRVDAKLITAQNLLNTPKVDIPTGGVEVLLVAANPARAAVRFFNSGAKDVWIGAAGLNLVNACVKIAAGGLWIEEVAAGAAWVGLCAPADSSVIKIQEITY